MDDGFTKPRRNSRHKVKYKRMLSWRGRRRDQRLFGGSLLVLALFMNLQLFRCWVQDSFGKEKPDAMTHHHGDLTPDSNVPSKASLSTSTESKVLSHLRFPRFIKSEKLHKNEIHKEGEMCKESFGDFPANFFDDKTAKEGAWLINLFISIYLFGCVAQVCDDYFVPSLEHICEDLGLSQDVAGATFMAAGSSAPELCTSLIGLFIAKSNVGVGAIIGSSIFNILVIVGAVGICAGMPLFISWYSLSRDSLMYIISVGIMAYSMNDGVIKWWEASALVVAYFFYIMLMVFNQCIRAYITDAVSNKIGPPNEVKAHRSSMALAINCDARRRSRITAGTRVDPICLKSVSKDLSNLAAMDGVKRDIALDHIQRYSSLRLIQDENQKTASPKEKRDTTVEGLKGPGEIDAGFESSTDPVVMPQDDSASSSKNNAENSEHIIDEYRNPLECPDGIFNKFTWLLFLPFTVIHAFTIPDSRILGGWQEKLYLLSFTLAVLYIALYSYGMVWMALYAGKAVGLPDTVVGMTVLAAGTSVPDMMSSIYVARDGYGDMAVSNAIGSNIFDILIGLGIPWLIGGLLENDSGTDIDSRGTFYICLVLFATVAYMWSCIACNNWTLTSTTGAVTLLVYIIIITFCILVEMNVIFKFHIKCQPAL